MQGRQEEGDSFEKDLLFSKSYFVLQPPSSPTWFAYVVGKAEDQNKTKFDLFMQVEYVVSAEKGKKACEDLLFFLEEVIERLVVYALIGSVLEEAIFCCVPTFFCAADDREKRTPRGSMTCYASTCILATMDASGVKFLLSIAAAQRGKTGG